MKPRIFSLACQALLVVSGVALAQTFEPIDVPGAASTQAWGINSHGEIVGFYVNPDTTVHGFLLKGGEFQPIDVPDASSTQAYGINPQGDIVGVYAANGVSHGFLFSGGRYTSIDPPGSTRSGAAGINANGEIVGDCFIDGVTRGFFLKGSRYEIVEYAGSASGFLNGINARGDVVGLYTANAVSRGYIRREAKFTSVEIPAATFTGTFGINAAGEIVGRFRDSANVTHGFYLINGEVTRFDYPGATFTAGNAISANGDIVGRFQRADGVNHGYLYSRLSRPRYKVTDLGTLGGKDSIAYGTNTAGVITGAASLPSQVQRGFVWRGGVMTELGTLGGLNAAATNPNGAGLVTVVSEVKSDPDGEDFCGWGTHQSCLAAVWKDGKLTGLPTLGGNNSLGFVMNERGQTAGTAETKMRDSDCTAPQIFRYQPVIWDAIAAKVQPLGLPKGDTVGIALGLNDRGDAVGTTGTCADTTVSAIGLMFGPHATFWRNGRVTSLGNGVAASINNRGEVTGESPSEEGVHGFLWTSERGMLDLGTVAGDVFSFPTVINNSGQITGASCDGEMNCRAFLWDANTSAMVDLNDLVDGDSSLQLVFASWINDAGDVVGQAVDKTTGNLHAFLATPARGGSTATVTSTSAPFPSSVNVREELRKRWGISAQGRRAR